MNVKYNNEKIIELYNSGKTDQEMADFFGVTKSAMECKRRTLGLKARTKALREDYIPTAQEIAIIIGTLLGDSTIRYVHDRCKYPNLTFVHSPKQEEYFKKLAEKLKNFKASAKKYKDNNKLNPYGCKYVFTGRNMRCLIEFRNKFYVNGTKIIPIDVIEKHFTEESLYYMFMDNGSYDKSSNSYIINTQCFDKTNLQDFCEVLYKKFNLCFNIKTDNCLYLQHKSNELFQSILLKYNECDSMIYKCGKLSLNSVKQGKS